MSPTGITKIPKGMLTEAQWEALKWLRAHNGDGHFGGRGGTLMAAGEIAPVMRSTWNVLEKLGFVEFYNLRRRLRLVLDPDNLQHDSDLA